MRAPGRCWRRPRPRVGAAAEFGLGDLYFRGMGVEVDKARAADHYERAAANGHIRAKTALATILYDGLGRPMDRLRGAKLFFEAADGRGVASRNIAPA